MTKNNLKTGVLPTLEASCMSIIKIVLVHAIQICGGCIASRILKFDAGWRYVVSFTLRPLPLGKESPISIG
jgi:hypothetical protein